MPLLKRLFWVYFLLLIFEGALRKWVLPQLSAPLLLVRDPVALLIIWEAYRTRKWPKRWSTAIRVLAVAMLTLSIIQMVIGDNPWMIALYGLRSYLLPFPVAFIMGENIQEEDLRKFGVWVIWLLFPLVGLAVLQYLAPADSILNKGAYQGAEQIAYAGGHVRASATFSFTTGLGSYVPMAAAFVFFGIVDSTQAKRGLLLAAFFSLILSIPIVGSRGMAVSMIAVLASVALSAFFGVSQVSSILKIAAVGLIAAVLVFQLSIFSEASITFQDRLNSSFGAEGGAEGVARTRAGSPISEFMNFDFSSTPWYGYGMGIGSNAASTLLSGTQGAFVAGEGETSRLLYEFGPVFGVAFILFRLALVVAIGYQAFSEMRQRRPLAWFLLPLLIIGLSSTLEQPTAQGFMVILIGFSLAAIKRSSVTAESPQTLSPLRRVQRRSQE